MAASQRLRASNGRRASFPLPQPGGVRDVRDDWSAVHGAPLPLPSTAPSRGVCRVERRRQRGVLAQERRGSRCRLEDNVQACVPRFGVAGEVIYIGLFGPCAHLRQLRVGVRHGFPWRRRAACIRVRVGSSCRDSAGCCFLIGLPRACARRTCSRARRRHWQHRRRRSAHLCARSRAAREWRCRCG